MSPNRIRRVVSLPLAFSVLLCLITYPGQSSASAPLSYSGGIPKSNAARTGIPASPAGKHESSSTNITPNECNVAIAVTQLSPFFNTSNNQLFIPPIEIVASIDVTAADPCWQANTDVSWLAVISVVMDHNDPPDGNGTVNFQIEANFTPERRIGRLLIGDQVFTVFQGARFDDVPPGHPFFTEIGLLSAHGITSGCGIGLFCPDSGTTRAQMAVLLLRSKGIFDPPTPAGQTFSDVPPTHPFFAFIEELAAQGITFGCGGGLYCPESLVSREQMAAFIIRGLGEFNPPTPPMQRFADVPPSNIFYNFIDRLAELGITNGCSASPPLYCPLDFVTRGQTAVFLVRAFNL